MVDQPDDDVCVLHANVDVACVMRRRQGSFDATVGDAVLRLTSPLNPLYMGSGDFFTTREN